MIGSPSSLQGRLLGLMLGMVVAVWLATAALTWFDVRHELDDLLDGHLAQAAALLVAQQTGHLEEDDDHGIDAPSLHRYAPKVAFQVFHEGRLSMRSANAPSMPMVSSDRAIPGTFTTSLLNGAPWRVFVAHGIEQDVVVYVGEETRSRDLILWAVLRSTLWPIGVALPLLALAAWWAVYRGVEPMRKLGHALTVRPAQSLEPLHLDNAPSEMAPMLKALNGLFTRISTLLESERRFTADAAHELRTPIAAIRTQAQVAMSEPDPALRHHALQNTLDGCDRATRLVAQLLTLARLEAVSPTAMAQLDLSQLTQGVLADIAPKAIGKGQTIELNAPAPCLVSGDEALLSVLVRNLVDNAVRYSPPAATVKVSVAAQGQEVVLTVQDSGPGLAQTDLQRLGERFFRAMGSQESGSGLGWSIVQRIAAVHQMPWQVAHSTELGGLAVTVHFHRAPQA